MHSGISLGRSDGRPIYIQIIEQVRHRIALGDWPSGYPLPSIRELASELRVSVITVKRAYLELERDGIIVTRQGVGSAVADGPTLRDHLLESEISEQIERLAHRAVLLGMNADDITTRVMDAMRRAVSSRTSG